MCALVKTRNQLRLLHVFVGATVSFQVQDAVVGITRLDVRPETVHDIDHEQRQIRRIGDPGGGDVHKVFQAPVLFGISKVKLNLEPQPIIVDEGRICQVQVTAEQDDMGAGVGAQVGLGDDDDIQRLCELFVEQLRLVETGLDVPLHRGLFEVLHGEVVVIHLVAILAMGTSPGIGSRVGEVQRRIVPQLGNQVEMALPCHLQGVVVAEVPVEHQIGQRDHACDQVQQGVEPAGNPP